MEEQNQMSWLLWIILIIFLVWFLMDYFRKRNYYEGLDDKYTPGNPCTSNDQCSSGACAVLSAGSEMKLCCPFDKIVNVDGVDHCGDLLPGTICKSPKVCKNGQCLYQTATRKYGTCN